MSSSRAPAATAWEASLWGGKCVKGLCVRRVVQGYGNVEGITVVIWGSSSYHLLDFLGHGICAFGKADDAGDEDAGAAEKLDAMGDPF